MMWLGQCTDVDDIDLFAVAEKDSAVPAQACGVFLRLPGASCQVSDTLMKQNHFNNLF